MSIVEIVRDRAGDVPIEMGMILGSGLGALADEMEEATAIPFGELPGMPRSGVTGHAGAFVVGRLEGRRVAILSGRVHYYEHGQPAIMRPAIEALAELGAESLLLTNAAGSTRAEVGPGSLMLITDHLNWSGLNPLIGEEGDARFVPMTDAYAPALQERMRAAARVEGIDLSEGVYAWFSGPSFETPAEIRAIRTLGADAVGMPETILARRFGLPVAAVSVITNLAAGLPGAEIGHDDTKKQAALARERFARLVRAYVKGS
ncbi:MAG: purine-nucleoside phosphorylase [Rubricella sp.]